MASTPRDPRHCKLGLSKNDDGNCRKIKLNIEMKMESPLNSGVTIENPWHNKLVFPNAQS